MEKQNELELKRLQEQHQQQQDDSDSSDFDSGSDSEDDPMAIRRQNARSQFVRSFTNAANTFSRTSGQLRNAKKIIAEQKLQLKKASKRIEKVKEENVKISNELKEERKKRLEREKNFEKLVPDLENAKVKLSGFQESETTINSIEEQVSCSKKAKLDGLDERKINGVEEMAQVSTKSIENDEDNAGFGYSGHVLMEKDQKTDQKCFF